MNAAGDGEQEGVLDDGGENGLVGDTLACEALCHGIDRPLLETALAVESEVEGAANNDFKAIADRPLPGGASEDAPTDPRRRIRTDSA